MALDPVVNFFRSEIATLPLASGTTTMVITTGDGNKLPNPSTDGAFNLTIYNADDPFVTPEIVRVTAKSGDSLTITRAQEGTSATNKTTGSTWYVELVPTAKTIQDIDDKKLDVAGGTMTGDLTIPDKIIHSGDTNTFISFPSADTIGLETGGSRRVTVTDTGVGINTTSPSATLDVNGPIRVGTTSYYFSGSKGLGNNVTTDFLTISVPVNTVSCYTKIKYVGFKNNAGSLTHESGEYLIVWRCDAASPAIAASKSHVGSNIITFSESLNTTTRTLTISGNIGSAATSQLFHFGVEVVAINPPTFTIP